LAQARAAPWASRRSLGRRGQGDGSAGQGGVYNLGTFTFDRKTVIAHNLELLAARAISYEVVGPPSRRQENRRRPSSH